MNEGLALACLQKVLGWTEEQVQHESQWLRFISDFKYDNYQDFIAGARFVECLVDWLQQFNASDRISAYNYVRENLLFFNTPQIHHLVGQFFPSVVQENLMRKVASDFKTHPFLLWEVPGADKAFQMALRKSLFLGMSDGARMDVFRRKCEGLVFNEQVGAGFELSDEKWDDFLSDLQKNLDDSSARFDDVYLIDDFVGSGTTLLRKRKGSWTGKLMRFWKQCREHKLFDKILSANYQIHIHHYVGSHYGKQKVAEDYVQAFGELKKDGWFERVHHTYGLVLPENLPLDEERHAEFWKLTENYYNKAIESDSMREGGEHARRGFGNCGLPLVFEHNTPNNSISLFWAEVREDEPGEGHAMRPLFRRRQRHW